MVTSVCVTMTVTSKDTSIPIHSIHSTIMTRVTVIRVWVAILPRLISCWPGDHSCHRCPSIRDSLSRSPIGGSVLPSLHLWIECSLRRIMSSLGLSLVRYRWVSFPNQVPLHTKKLMDHRRRITRRSKVQNSRWEARKSSHQRIRIDPSHPRISIRTSPWLQIRHFGYRMMSPSSKLTRMFTLRRIVQLHGHHRMWKNWSRMSTMKSTLKRFW